MRAVDSPPPGFYAPDPYSGRWFWIGVALNPAAPEPERWDAEAAVYDRSLGPLLAAACQHDFGGRARAVRRVSSTQEQNIAGIKLIV